MARQTTPTAPFTVTGRRRNGTTTYLCRNAEWALRKFGDFERMGYEGIAVTGPDGASIGTADLERLARGVGRPALAAT